MRHIPDFVIYLTGMVSTVLFVFCGIYFTSNKTLGIWSLYGGLVFGLLTGFLYWQNDISKTHATKPLNAQTEQLERKHADDMSHSPPSPQKKLVKAKPLKDEGKQPMVLPKKPEETLPNTTQTARSQLTNGQLQKEVLILVDKMRGYLERRNLQEQSRSSYNQQQMRQAKTEGERQIVWDAQTHDLLTSPNLNFEYSEKFKAEAVLLRNELLSRLPTDYRSDNKSRVDYDHPTNPIGLNMVIDDLDKLAKSLPK